MSVINTNITSLIGQQNLKESQNALETSFERLSSGLRINSAKDDAAGQAIANRITAQVTGLGQAQRNANDGISVAQTAEGGLDQVNENLQRIRELSVQAQNGANSSDDLESIQGEITQRLNEIDRISGETDFNGTKVLSDNQSLQIQVGANDGETINVSLDETTSDTLKMSSFDVTNRVELSQNFGATVSDTDKIDARFEVTELADLTDTTGGTALADVEAEGNLFEKDGGGVVALAEDGNYYDVDTSDATGLTFDSSTTAISQDQVKTDSGPLDSVVATTTLDTATNLSGADLTEINDSEGNGTGEYLLDNGDGTFNIADIEPNGTASNGDAVTVDPLQTIDSALSQVDSFRSDLGAVQNRFESAITNLNTNETNLTAARSRIEDADFAVEVANQTKNQILQQAGTSALAQANQLPQNVLSLLG